VDELLDSRPYRAASIAVFALLLCAPLLGYLGGVGDDVARLEFRRPAPRPGLALALGSPSEFTERMEAHLDDPFGFRSQLVTAHSLLHLAIGVSGSPRYLVGRNGWFFHRSVDHVLDQARGVNRFTTAELERWIAVMERRRRWLERRGIAFLVVIAPSKHSIYPEYLPAWFDRVGPTRYDQLVERLRRGSSLELLDLHGPLLRAKPDERLYFRSDGHWDDLGAFVAYREIAQWIAARYPAVRVLTRDDFELRWRSEPTGTITRGLNLVDFVPEDVPHLELRAASRVVERERLGSGPDYEWNRILVAKTGLEDTPKVMFIRDSFATPVARFLEESVREVVLVHHRRGTFPRREIRRFAPDIVIYEMIERGLAWPLRNP
jgi:alginate O-acetyltransferase complex protein AlgJ